MVSADSKVVLAYSKMVLANSKMVSARLWGFIVWKGVPFCVTFKLKNAEFFLSCVFSQKRCVSKTQFMRFIRLKKNENLCICLKGNSFSIYTKEEQVFIVIRLKDDMDGLTIPTPNVQHAACSHICRCIRSGAFAEILHHRRYMCYLTPINYIYELNFCANSYHALSLSEKLTTDNRQR